MRRNAFLLVLISLLSGFGSTAMTLAAGLWVLDLTGSVSLAALTAVCLYLPTFAGPWLGGLVDRLPRRPLLIVADLALGAILLTLLTVHSAAGVWLIFAVLLVRGVSYVVIDAGETAILPSALPMSMLGDVNGWRSSAQEGMKLVAPLAGAGLYAWRGAVPVILLSAAMPLFTAACYAALRVGRPTATPDRPGDSGGGPREAHGRPGNSGGGLHAANGRPGKSGGGAREARGRPGDSSGGLPGADGRPGDSRGGLRGADGRSGDSRAGLREGLRALFGIAAVRTPVVVAAVAIGMSGLCNAAVLAHLVHDLGLPSTRLGFLATAQGAGSIAGGLVVGRVLARSSPVRVAALGAVVFAGGCLSWALPWWPAMIAGSVLVGVGLPWALIAGITAVQTRTPEHLLGRVGATANTVMFGPVALGIPAGSVLVHVGAVVPLIVSAVLCAATAIVAVRAAAADRSRVPVR
ncbi:MFS transporter [Paractinoplanes deccanensis]|uniref:MFS transporter n=1 Tax=Paractinoplanes deccanensis TaxID=113561 RepID=A0ABQ3YDJ6_9ACTN|nr:MFS transporter [Actinoplanes deccanensis]